MGTKPRKPAPPPEPSSTPSEPELPERWSIQRNAELVLRLLRGEALDAVSRESQVPALSERRVIVAPTEKAAHNDRIVRNTAKGRLLAAGRISLDINGTVGGARRSRWRLGVFVDRMVSRRPENVADDAYEPVVSPNVNGYRVSVLVGARSRQSVPEQGGEIAGSVVRIHQELVTHITLEQVHPCACTMRSGESRRHPVRTDDVVHIDQKVVRDDRPRARSHQNWRGNMLENVVDHQVIGGQIEVYAITQRGGILGPVEVVVPHFDSCRLLKPDMVPVGIERFDVLHPAAVRPVKCDPGRSGGIRVIQGQILHAVHIGAGAPPPCLRLLCGSPVRHIESRSYSHLISINGSYLDELLLGSTGTGIRARFEGKSRAASDKHATRIR